MWMRRNGNFETKPPWYVAHVWPINVCLCGRGVGDPTRRTSGYVFPGVLWLLPLLSVVSEWDPSSPVALHHIFQPPRGCNRLVPGPSRRQNFQPCGSMLFFFFWHRYIFLELQTFFFYFGQCRAAVLRKLWGIFRTKNTTVLRNGRITME